MVVGRESKYNLFPYNSQRKENEKNIVQSLEDNGVIVE
jgi:hypothetical protein